MSSVISISAVTLVPFPLQSIVVHVPPLVVVRALPPLSPQRGLVSAEELQDKRESTYRYGNLIFVMTVDYTNVLAIAQQITTTG